MVIEIVFFHWFYGHDWNQSGDTAMLSRLLKTFGTFMTFDPLRTNY